MSNIAGRCACGAVRYTSPGPVLWAGHCHCESCRRAASAPFTSFFGVPRASVTWEGKLADRLSGKGRRFHCPNCGSQMTYQNPAWPDETHIYAATLDQPENFSPQAHYHYAEKLPWIKIDDQLPKYPGSADTTVPIEDA